MTLEFRKQTVAPQNPIAMKVDEVKKLHQIPIEVQRTIKAMAQFIVPRTTIEGFQRF